MIENLNILLQLFIFLIFFSTPLNLYNKHLVFKKIILVHMIAFF